MSSRSFSDKLESGGIGTGSKKLSDIRHWKQNSRSKKKKKGSKKDRFINGEFGRRTIIRPAGPPIARMAGIMI